MTEVLLSDQEGGNSGVMNDYMVTKTLFQWFLDIPNFPIGSYTVKIPLAYIFPSIIDLKIFYLFDYL